MTLRTRLLIAVGGLIAVALVATGILVVGITRQNLVDQLDGDLRGASQSQLSLGPTPGDDEPTGRRFALMVFGHDGSQLGAVPSGLPYSPDSLPNLPAGGVGALPIGQILELPAQHGALRYRVLALNAIYRGELPPTPVVAVLGAPMAGVEASVSVLIRALAVVGVAVLVVALVAGWFLIRRDLRPLEKVTATASRISEGDLSQRVGMSEHTSEVGRLGSAFDSMLDQIQSAFESQQRALDAKERSERQLRQFVADASHELRTPLTTLRGYTDLYRAGGLDEETALDQAMMRINTESRRMADLVEDMLLLARLDQGRPLAHVRVPMSELVEDAVSDARAVEPDRQINANIDGGVVVLGDEDRLRQVVGNLFTNVRVHTAASTPIDVSLSTNNGRCRFVVADHGAGVDPSHVAHIFDRFYRADPGRSRDRGGSGLGLSIAASVVDAHGGAIAYSETPGGGATFTVELPRAPG
jgi:two-component system OmpR family sensor kinase